MYLKLTSVLQMSAQATTLPFRTERQVLSCCHAPWLSGMWDPPTSPETCRTARQTHSSPTAVLGFQVQFLPFHILESTVAICLIVHMVRTATAGRLLTRADCCPASVSTSMTPILLTALPGSWFRQLSGSPAIRHVAPACQLRDLQDSRPHPQPLILHLADSQQRTAMLALGSTASTCL